MFEYMYLDEAEGVNPSEIDDLNDLGSEGWELVAVIPWPVKIGQMVTQANRWYFKREKDILKNSA